MATAVTPARHALRLLALAAVWVSVAAAAKVPALYVFGDSTADVGSNNYLPGSAVPRANFPHNGIDFPTSRATGRFSNGYNGIDFLDAVKKPTRRRARGAGSFRMYVTPRICWCCCREVACAQSIASASRFPPRGSRADVGMRGSQNVAASRSAAAGPVTHHAHSFGPFTTLSEHADGLVYECIHQAPQIIRLQKSSWPRNRPPFSFFTFSGFLCDYFARLVSDFCCSLVTKVFCQLHQLLTWDSSEAPRHSSRWLTRPTSKSRKGCWE